MKNAVEPYASGNSSQDQKRRFKLRRSHYYNPPHQYFVLTDSLITVFAYPEF
jgi:hypothetical protein